PGRPAGAARHRVALAPSAAAPSGPPSATSPSRPVAPWRRSRPPRGRRAARRRGSPRTATEANSTRARVHGYPARGARLGAMVSTTVHLLRHGEVHNPDGILYGRLPGYRLSDRGQ